MTREKAAGLLQVIEAYAKGDPIQIRLRNSSDPWQNYTGNCADFSNDAWEWRLQPRQRDLWLVAPKGQDDIHNFSIWDKPPELDPEQYQSIHVREVTEK